MSQLECDRCGNHYDPGREPRRPGMDTSRCPSCGARNEPDKPRADGGSDAVVTIEIRIRGGDVEIR